VETIQCAEVVIFFDVASIDDIRKDSDNYTRTPRKPFGAAAGGVFGGALGAGGMMPSDLAAVAGTPSNLGKIADACMFCTSIVLRCLDDLSQLLRMLTHSV
jgi:hypothetical protein